MSIERRILEQVRNMIQQASGDDYHRWFKINRFIWARLQLDERKQKRIIKKLLFKKHKACDCCRKIFVSRKHIDLHRIDPLKGYVLGNCELLHPACHRRRERAVGGKFPKVQHGRASNRSDKVSKRYNAKAYLYWWDITPGPAHRHLLKTRGGYSLVERDTHKRHALNASAIEKYLTAERQTTRGRGNWGIRILRVRPESLALEPANKSQRWLFLPSTKPSGFDDTSR